MEPLKLPGQWGQYTGNVLYPNEDSAIWDVDSTYSLIRPHHFIFALAILIKSMKS